MTRSWSSTEKVTNISVLRVLRVLKYIVFGSTTFRLVLSKKVFPRIGKHGPGGKSSKEERVTDMSSGKDANLSSSATYLYSTQQNIGGN